MTKKPKYKPAKIACPFWPPRVQSERPLPAWRGEGYPGRLAWSVRRGEPGGLRIMASKGRRGKGTLLPWWGGGWPLSPAPDEGGGGAEKGIGVEDEVKKNKFKM
jgi:hypothetical protein